MEPIQLVKDVRPMFADFLKEALAERDRLIPIAHIYLTDLFVESIHPDGSQRAPILPSELEEALIRVIGDVNKQTSKTGDYRYFQRIGDGLLLATSYWPASISPAERKARPPVEFYAGKGSEVYSLTYRLSGREVFGEMSSGFIQYAGALRDAMEKIARAQASTPVTEIVIADQLDIERFTQTGLIKQEKEKN
ncbi:hypothetical protein KY363_00635 [Candidatus Woesearchaeota archaeon]|nr:hypothetical protein [Candidatus Woesearchaeota archaeon]